MSNCSSIELLCKKQFCVFGWVYFKVLHSVSIYVSIPLPMTHCLDYYSCIISLSKLYLFCSSLYPQLLKECLASCRYTIHFKIFLRYNSVMKIFSVLYNMVATCPMWLFNTWNMASETEELILNVFYLILVNLNVNNYL